MTNLAAKSLFDLKQVTTKLRTELARLRKIEATLKQAPEAMMDTREALGVCALKEEDFPALEAMMGKRVKLVVVEAKEQKGLPNKKYKQIKGLICTKSL